LDNQTKTISNKERDTPTPADANPDANHDDAALHSAAVDPGVILTNLANGGSSSREYPAGELVFSQGDPADAVFYIQHGKVQLTVISQSGKEVVMAVLPESSFFGEGCLAGQPLRMSNAATAEPSILIRVTSEAMAALLVEQPKFAERFMSYLLSRNIRIEADWADLLATADNTILCIDDEPLGLVARKMMLQHKGYDVLTAQSGPEGLKLFTDNPVEAVVLDYSMPGMNGDIVAEELKRLNPEVKILLLSAHIDLPEGALRHVDKRSVKGTSPTSFLSDLEQLLSC
jgi:CRP-like cAMP-binding protein